MAGWFGNNPRDDIDWALALDGGRRRAQAAAAAWNASQVASAANIARNAPWLPPGVVLSLAKGNADPATVATAARAGATALAGRPNDVVPGQRVRGAQASPGDPRLFGREREAFYFDTVVPEAQRSRREEAFLGRAPGDMRPGASRMDDLTRVGILTADGRLNRPTPPRYGRAQGREREGGEFGSRGYLSAEDARIDRMFLDLMDSIGGEDPIPYQSDGRMFLFHPSTGRSERVPEGHTADLPGVFGAVQRFAEDRHLPTIADVPGMEGVPTQDVAGPDVGAWMANRRLPSLADVPGLERTGVGRATETSTAGVGVDTPRAAFQELFMGLNAPIQEFTGQIRNVYAAGVAVAGGAGVGEALGSQSWLEPQSDFLIRHTTGMDPGDGLFVDPDEELAQERLRREEERGQIYGQNVTLGRIVAGGAARIGVIEPGDTAYRVMSGLVDAVPQIYDPSAMATAGVARANLARRTFTAAGEATEVAATATPKLRALAASFDIPGRSRMARPELLDALRTVDLNAVSTQRLRGLASSLNIAGRSRMNKADLAAAVRNSWDNLGATTIRPGEIIEPTGRVEAFARGMAEVTRSTGVPQLLERTGLIKGSFTRGVHGPSREAWLASPEAKPKLQAIADTDNGAEIWRLMNNKPLPEELRRLRAASTTDEVRDVLRPLLGERFRTVDEVWRSGDPLPFVSAVRDTRALANVPGSEIDIDDPQAPLREIEAWMRNAHVGDEVVDDFVNRMIDADGYAGVMNVVNQAMEHTDGVLAAAGVQSAALRKALTRAYSREAGMAQEWFISEGAEQQSLLDEIDVGGKVHPTGGPFMWANLYNRFIYLPDFREIRRLTSKYPNIGWTAEGKLRAPARFVAAAQEDIWKPFALLRGAWPVRVIGEEQLRMGAANFASMFHDPLSYLAYVVARRTDVTGDTFAAAREYQEAIVRRSAGFLTERPGRVRTGRQVPLEKGDPNYDRSLAETLAELYRDPVAQKVAEMGDLNAVEDWLNTASDGKAVLARLTEDHPEVFADPFAVRRYVENANYWNNYITGGNADLLEVVRSGRLPRRGRLPDIPALNPDGQTLTSTFRRHISRSYSEAGPTRILGEEVPSQANQRGATVERLFTWLMAKPTNYLSRSPVFRQAYMRRVEELVGFGSAKAKKGLLEALSRTEHPTLGRWEVKGVNVAAASKATRKRIADIEAKGRLTLDEIDAYAKGYALEEVQRLLYDLSNRSQIADSLRLIAPFGEAWREVVTRWASLANPLAAHGLRNLRRFSQVINGVRGEDFGEVLDAPETLDGDQRGFFWKDEFGEEVFVYPGSQWITGSITAALGEKVPVPMIGRAQGLSMFGEIIPGIGPAASIPVAALLGDSPGWRRDLREWLLPYGSVMDEEGASAITQVVNYAPAWLRRFVQAVKGGGFDMETNRLYANTVMSTANYLYSTGKYDTSTEDGQALLLADAKQSARVLYGVRAAMAFGAPSAPSFDWMVETDEGTIRFAILRDEYYRLIEEGGYEDADELFLDRFGQGVGLTMQAHTREVTGGIEPTTQYEDWAKANSGLRTDLPNVWGWFGPGGGDFDYNVYVRQIARGDREQLTPDEWLGLGMNHLGQMLRDRLVDVLGPESDWTDEDRDFKREVERRIAAEYPGYNDFSGLEQRADFEDDILPELERAVEDERVLATEAGQGLRLYWMARQKILTYAQEELGLVGIGRAEALASDREWLFMVGEAIVKEYPDFAPLWDRHLSHEVDPEEG